MNPERKTLVFPLLFMAVGTGWLLTTLGVVPGVNWVWTLGLAILGLLTFIIFGLDKISCVLGPFLIASSTFSVLRQTDRLHFDLEVPILVIIAGALMLVARLPAVPMPKLFMQDPTGGR